MTCALEGGFFATGPRTQPLKGCPTVSRQQRSALAQGRPQGSPGLVSPAPTVCSPRRTRTVLPGLPRNAGARLASQEDSASPASSRHPEHSHQTAATWGATSVAPNGLTLRRWEGKLGGLLSPGAEPVCVVAVRPSGGWGPVAAGNPRPGLSPGDWPAWEQDRVGRGRPTGSTLGTQAAGTHSSEAVWVPPGTRFQDSLGRGRAGRLRQSWLPPHPSAGRLLQPAQLSSLWCPGLRMRLLPANQERRSEVPSPLPCWPPRGWDGPAGSEGQAGTLAPRPGPWQGPP